MTTDSAPVTKADLAAVSEASDIKLGRLEDALASFRSDMLLRFDEERRHTTVMFEQLKHDLLGAFRDFASVAKDKQENHERRLQRLERIAGVIAA